MAAAAIRVLPNTIIPEQSVKMVPRFGPVTLSTLFTLLALGTHEIIFSILRQAWACVASSFT